MVIFVLMGVMISPPGPYSPKPFQHVRCVRFLVGHPPDALHTSGKTQKDGGNVLFGNARSFYAAIVAQDGLKSLWKALDIDTAVAETIGRFPGAWLGWIANYAAKEGVQGVRDRR